MNLAKIEAHPRPLKITDMVPLACAGFCGEEYFSRGDIGTPYYRLEARSFSGQLAYVAYEFTEY